MYNRTLRSKTVKVPRSRRSQVSERWGGGGGYCVSSTRDALRFMYILTMLHMFQAYVYVLSIVDDSGARKREIGCFTVVGSDYWRYRSTFGRASRLVLLQDNIR